MLLFPELGTRTKMMLTLRVTVILLQIFFPKGLWDQALALSWVRDHIAAFGGDPNNVTLIGEGSGAVCAGYHIVSPRSTGLFNKVVLMSGSPVCPTSRDDKSRIKGCFKCPFIN